MPCCCRGKYSGPEGPRLAALRLAAQLGFAYVDIELKAAKEFIGSSGRKPETTRLIVSSHNYEETPPTEELLGLVDRYAAGAWGHVPCECCKATSCYQLLWCTSDRKATPAAGKCLLCCTATARIEDFAAAASTVAAAKDCHVTGTAYPHAPRSLRVLFKILSLAVGGTKPTQHVACIAGVLQPARTS